MQERPAMEIITPNSQDAENSIRTILRFLGEDPEREGLKDTPDRIVRSWEKLFWGYGYCGTDVLATTFEECGNYDEMVLLKNIDFFSTCEHHFLPFSGKVHIAYIPDKIVVGISKLARLVEVHSRRLQIQERMTANIAMDIETVLHPLGVAVLVEAQHMCMTARGVEKINAKMTTSKLTGAFKDNLETRQEFLTLIKG
jgi:GTP cyclohydrolase I